jgi:hypothetical protein
MAALGHSSGRNNPSKSIEQPLLNMGRDPIPQRTIETIRELIATIFVKYVFSEGAKFVYKC